MSLIRTWAAAHSIPLAAVLDLEMRLGVAAGPVDRGVHLPVMNMLGSESRQQALVRIEAAQKDIWLFRNNVGALQDENGRLVRYGLANDNVQLNSRLKSGDLIGWRKHRVTQADVGNHLALFVSRECKREGWQYSGDTREVAQMNWNNLVNSSGGDAAFCTGPGSFHYGTP